jgi:hypothetical protein
MIGRVEETSASSKPGPRLDSTRLRGALSNERPYRDKMPFAAVHESRSWHITAKRHAVLYPELAKADMGPFWRDSGFDPKQA